ncbi:MAG TPA: BMP family ABC transporter substrate-binding protein [Anaerolineae bacterium]|nr:BMP family ABC transporter substrate-binding protein [Anaerolineae bacterium]
MSKKIWLLIAVLLVLSMLAAACAPAATPAPTQPPAPTQAPTQAPAATQPPAPTQAVEPTKAPEPTQATEPFTFGMILVGPQNDKGWSQANYDAGKYVEEKLGAKMIVIDKVNTADRPNTTPDQVAADMIKQGAKMVFFTSDDMKDGALLGAEQNPKVPMIFTSGDTAWKDGKDYHADLTNMGNIMGRMEYGKMIGGCAAALTSEKGSIGYLGPLINDETRRLADSVFLGARYCWENYRNKDPKDLKFDVKWIGFWFNIPGVTLDPTQVANEFFDSGADVVVSGIDTTEALVVAGQRADKGEKVWAVPYDFKGACDQSPKVCLGSPYFNWGPAYVKAVQAAMDGKFQATFEWNGPDWKDINNPDTSAVGFAKGPGLSADNGATLDKFIAGLGDGSIDLWKGPLNYQDGSAFLKDSEKATDLQVWYMPQLLEGMTGASQATK